MNQDFMSRLEAAGIETKLTIERFSGNADLYEQFLQRFPSDDTFGKIGPAFDNGDFDEALAAAHTLKGVSANLGMTRLYKACSDTVALIRAKDPEGAKKSYPEIKNAYDEICALINEVGKKDK